MALKTARLSREESQAQTRDRLLDAARNLVVRRGFAGASVRDIAEAAGYSQGAFYSNFASKEAVLLDLMRQHKDEEVARLSLMLDSVEADPSRLIDGFEQWAEALETDTEWTLLSAELQLHAHRNPQFAREYGAMMAIQRERFGALIGRTVALTGKPVPPADELSILSTGMIALVTGLALQRPIAMPGASRNAFMTFLHGLIAATG
jgi:AcrR family transcriptional regulator